MKFCFITNDTSFVAIAEHSNIDRIIIDLERKGKQLRQTGKELFLSDHTIQDISAVKPLLKQTNLMVRINPLDHNSKNEIDNVISKGADIIMLPYFKEVEEAELVCRYVAGRAKVSLLVETAESVKNILYLSQLADVDEIHIGLNDLCISMNFKSIFEPIYNGTLEHICTILEKSGKAYGFGGVGRLSYSGLPINPELILAEQIRLGCSIGWLGRTFRTNLNADLFKGEIMLLNAKIKEWEQASDEKWIRHTQELIREITHWESVLHS